MLGKKAATYEEYLFRSPSAGIGVLFAKSDEFFSKALGFFGFVPGGSDGFVRYEGGDEVSEEGLSVGGAAVEVAEFHMATGHWDCMGKVGDPKNGRGLRCFKHQTLNVSSLKF